MRHRVRGQPEDGRASPARVGLLAPDQPRGARPVEIGHLHVHQDDVEISALPRIHRLQPVRHQHGLDADLVQQRLEHQLVGRIVL